MQHKYDLTWCIDDVMLTESSNSHHHDSVMTSPGTTKLQAEPWKPSPSKLNKLCSYHFNGAAALPLHQHTHTHPLCPGVSRPLSLSFDGLPLSSSHSGRGILCSFRWSSTIVLLEIINSNPHQKALVAPGPCSGEWKARGRKGARAAALCPTFSSIRRERSEKGPRALLKWCWRPPPPVAPSGPERPRCEHMAGITAGEWVVERRCGFQTETKCFSL